MADELMADLEGSDEEEEPEVKEEEEDICTFKNPPLKFSSPSFLMSS